MESDVYSETNEKKQKRNVGAIKKLRDWEALYQRKCRELRQGRRLNRNYGHAGIFIPSLAYGGAFGRLIGIGVQALLRSSGSSVVVSLPAYTVTRLNALK
jgi:hypothetical protein